MWVFVREVNPLRGWGFPGSRTLYWIPPQPHFFSLLVGTGWKLFFGDRGGFSARWWWIFERQGCGLGKGARQRCLGGAKKHRSLSQLTLEGCNWQHVANQSEEGEKGESSAQGGSFQFTARRKLRLQLRRPQKPEVMGTSGWEKLVVTLDSKIAALSRGRSESGKCGWLRMLDHSIRDQVIGYEMQGSCRICGCGVKIWSLCTGE